MPLGYAILSKVVPCFLPSCFMFFFWAPYGATVLPLQTPGQTTRKQLALGREILYNINPSRLSALHLPCFLQYVQQQYLGEPAKVGNRPTMPARSPSVGIPSRAIVLPGIMFATLGVSPAGRLGPNPCHPSPKVTNKPLGQISTPLSWNIWSIASYQFVLKSFTNSYNQDPAPL